MGKILLYKDGKEVAQLDNAVITSLKKVGGRIISTKMGDVSVGCKTQYTIISSHTVESQLRLNEIYQVKFIQEEGSEYTGFGSVAITDSEIIIKGQFQ